MAITVEDGSGLPNANSYVSVAEVDTYNSDYLGKAAWDAAAEADKEKACRVATQFIDAMYFSRWLGLPRNTNQALDWPRYGAMKEDGYHFDYQSVPAVVKQATCELAIRAIDEALSSDESNPGTITQTSVKIGPISESISYIGGSQQKRFTIVSKILRPVLYGTDQLLRG